MYTMPFEMLLTDLSARFASVTPGLIDREITNAQRQIVLALDLHRSTIAQAQGSQGFVITHSWATPSAELTRGVIGAHLPYTENVISRGREVCFARIDDLPEEATQDKGTFARFGPRSCAVFPFNVGGKVIGAMSFGHLSREREWTNDVVNGLRVFVEIIGGGLGRIRAEESLGRALEEIRRLRDRLELEHTGQQNARSVARCPGLIGESEALRRVLAQVEQVALTNANVLLTGETGTGKDMVASAIHEFSLRSLRPMVRINCGAIPGTLVESELFGRERGAYTGAMSRQVGRFELAHGSTLFLDEVGELSPEVQAKLLRVLEQRKIERLGSSKSISIDVRLIAATNRDLEKAVRDRKFRDDLFYRLNVFRIHIPPLRERPEDIPFLVRSFVRHFAVSLGKGIEEIDQNSMRAMLQYPWPGNIRELRNIVERAVIMSTEPRLEIYPPTNNVDSAAKPTVSYLDVRREHLRTVLQMTGWRVRGKYGAAAILDLKPTTLDHMIARLGLTRPQKGVAH
jgi:formate hydrogenlyase transcriptional activator